MAMRSYQYIKANSIQFWILDKQFPDLLEIKTAKLVLHFLIKEGLERKRQSSRQKKSWKIMTKVYKIWPNCLDCPTWKVFLLNSSRGVSYKLHLYCPSFMRFDNNNNNVCLILKILFQLQTKRKRNFRLIAPCMSLFLMRRYLFNRRLPLSSEVPFLHTWGKVPNGNVFPFKTF